MTLLTSFIKKITTWHRFHLCYFAFSHHDFTFDPHNFGFYDPTSYCFNFKLFLCQIVLISRFIGQSPCVLDGYFIGNKFLKGC